MRANPIALAFLAVALAAGTALAQTGSSDEDGAPRPRPTQPVAVIGDRATTRYAFVSHAAFFSVETQQRQLVDPQVFVADPHSAAGPGLQNIVHAQGFRAAMMVDDPASALSNAQGVPFGYNLGTWLSARGSVNIAQRGRGRLLRIAFTNLIPEGKYSLFRMHFGEQNVTFTPLDGRGTANNFTADPGGRTTVQVSIPGDLPRGDGIVLVYHSDGEFHGRDRGVVGVSAHHQLIMRVP